MLAAYVAHRARMGEDLSDAAVASILAEGGAVTPESVTYALLSPSVSPERALGLHRLLVDQTDSAEDYVILSHVVDAMSRRGLRTMLQLRSEQWPFEDQLLFRATTAILNRVHQTNTKVTEDEYGVFTALVQRSHVTDQVSALVDATLHAFADPSDETRGAAALLHSVVGLRQRLVHREAPTLRYW
jgi:hypothetical protein